MKRTFTVAGKLCLLIVLRTDLVLYLVTEIVPDIGIYKFRICQQRLYVLLFHFLFLLNVNFFFSSQENKKCFSTCCKTSSYLGQIILESSSRHTSLNLEEFSQHPERLYDLINSSSLFLNFCNFKED